MDKFFSLVLLVVGVRGGGERERRKKRKFQDLYVERRRRIVADFKRENYRGRKRERIKLMRNI